MTAITEIIDYIRRVHHTGERGTAAGQRTEAEAVAGLGAHAKAGPINLCLVDAVHAGECIGVGVLGIVVLRRVWIATVVASGHDAPATDVMEVLARRRSRQH